MLGRLVKIFTSLRLTVTLLGLGAVLVFWGTLAQVDLGLYKAQNEFFRSFFIFWQPAGSSWRIPIFPGGYLLGGLLLINLFSAHLRYYQPGKKKYGIVMIHLGIVLLLLGQLLTDVLSQESSMHIRMGASKNYSESTREYELAFVDTTDADADKVVAIPGSLLSKGGDISHPELPFTVRVKEFFENSFLTETNTGGFSRVEATTGYSFELWWRKMPHETIMEQRDMPSGIIELGTPQGPLGSYLVSAFRSHRIEGDRYEWSPLELTHNGRNYLFGLRPTRSYKPFSLQLLEFRYDRYPGTDTPKNFSSRVRLQRPSTGEDREVLIYMNSPLRYAGETFYQADWDKGDEKGTILQVVHNPTWLTPYFSCVLVAAGLIVQFLTHLVTFATKRKTA